MKDKLSAKILEEFPALSPKTYICQTDDKNKNKKAKGRKRKL